MLDPRLVVEEADRLRAALARRGPVAAAELEAVLEVEQRRRTALRTVEELKRRRNEASEEMKRADKASPAFTRRREELRALGDEIRRAEEELAPLEQARDERLLVVPNAPHPSVPDGLEEAANVEIARWGEVPSFDGPPREHGALGEALGVLDFEAAARISGARFAVLRDGAARLSRGLAAFMLDLHTQRGYREVAPPYLVRRQAMVGTGQLPKFEEDAFKTQGDELFLIPTAEVPVTNLYREQILDGDRLPIRHCAYSPCFRAEAGSYGKDTRGLIRQHQFEKVELVALVRPEESLAELEKLTRDAEEVLQRLGLCYRKVEHCAGDLGFSAQKSYDLEVWLPGQGAYREISSCSDCGDFQARRAKIRYRPAPGDKPRLVHTLNGSGLAIGRTLVAIFEQCQRPDGTIAIPTALRPYVGGRDRIERGA